MKPSLYLLPNFDLYAPSGAFYMIYEITYTYQNQISWTYFHTEKQNYQKEGEKAFTQFRKELGWSRTAKLLGINAVRKSNEKPIVKTVRIKPVRKPKRSTSRATTKRRRSSNN